jgi:hypothetical protein
MILQISSTPAAISAGVLAREFAVAVYHAGAAGGGDERRRGRIRVGVAADFFGWRLGCHLASLGESN